MWLGSGIAVTMAVAYSCNSDWAPAWEILHAVDKAIKKKIKLVQVKCDVGAKKCSDSDFNKNLRILTMF